MKKKCLEKCLFSGFFAICRNIKSGTKNRGPRSSEVSAENICVKIKVLSELTIDIDSVQANLSDKISNLDPQPKMIIHDKYLKQNNLDL